MDELQEYEHHAPGGYTDRDWRRLLERQGHCCAFCGKGDRRLFRVRRIPAPRGGTNNIGNLVALCWTCKNYKHGRTWMEMRIRAHRMDTLRAAAEAGAFGPVHGGNALPVRRYRRFLTLATERGFLRANGRPYLATDPDACTCKGQAPHQLGAVVCRSFDRR